MGNAYISMCNYVSELEVFITCGIFDVVSPSCGYNTLNMVTMIEYKILTIK